MVQYLEGILKIANLLLATFAGIVAISLFRASKKKEFRPWRMLIIALVFFAIQQILGALRAFNIFSTPYLTHIAVSIILVFLIIALLAQININKEVTK
jgi:predicted membrane-bound dolichyl-phosphate-mannose-protein mannosyltransferase